MNKNLITTMLAMWMLLIVSCNTTTPSERYAKADASFNASVKVCKALVRYGHVDKPTAVKMLFVMDQGNKYLDLWDKALRKGDEATSLKYELLLKEALDTLIDYQRSFPSKEVKK